ncbi:AAA family ATPase [Streptomyces sp. NPDC047972]|uniref:AAA family ATPase n=1 Tax=Streptomyces sp. NPDC047972 TaxID=3365493 RepID=UPI003714E027
MAEIILPGFGLSGYRSFGSKMQYSGKLGAVTLLAGQNNSGKSNLIRMLSHVASGTTQLGQHDRPQGRPMDCFYALPFDVAAAFETVGKERKWNPRYIDPLLRAFTHPAIHWDGQTWISYELSGNVVQEQFDEVIASLGNSFIVSLLQNLGNLGFAPGGDVAAGRHNFHSLLSALLPRRRITSGLVALIEAHRQIQDLRDGEPSNSGNDEGLGLLPRLQRLQNPPAESHRDDSARFDAINRFVKTILDDDTARLEVQHDARTLNVFHSGRILPLENLGTGVHQVVILAAAATVHQGKVVCIEEPEVHLHPIYQRKFIRYLARETSNQYLIATHSAHMLDYQAAVVLHVRHDGVESRLAPAVTPSQLSGLCSDLGYRPSDLLQSNAVIWVEGPSDRIYISHWIKLLAPDLLEGLHYSIMFYGGGLLNQLSPSDEEIGDFIRLRHLNRYSAIVIDSDKKSPRAQLNATKRRVVEGFSEGAGDGFAWVTEGYTIENYVPHSLLAQAVSSVHPKSKMGWSGGKWENPLTLEGRKSVADKNRIARAVCDGWIDPPAATAHLGKMVRQCIEFINEANRSSAPLSIPR